MQQTCKCCGTCCRKGPPALHLEDAGLYLDRFLEKKDLLTLRKSELVFDNVQGNWIALTEEIIRIRTMQGKSACKFLDLETNLCRIYEQRPKECRFLKCWEPEELEKIYQKNRLQRKDLIPEKSALKELISWHEQKCSVEEVVRLSKGVKSGSRKDAAALAPILDKDMQVRQYMQDNFQADIKSLEFILGRPVQKILPAFGLEAFRTEEGFRFNVKSVTG